MSYCRWSSDNWKSDIYCYTSSEGHVIEVANRRRIDEIPEIPLPTNKDVSDKEFKEALKKQQKALDECRMEDIGLPLDGAHIVCETLETLLSRLIDLKKMGYHVPESAIYRIAVDSGKDARLSVKNKL